MDIVATVADNVYYAAASLDGFIADPAENLEWLTEFEPAGYTGGDAAGEPDDAITAFIETVGALVMGSRTYEFILAHGSWPYGERPSWVLSSRRLEPIEAASGLRFASGDVSSLDDEIRAAAGDRDVWVVGGGDVASQYVAAGLLDRVQVTVVPITLGAGLPLFAEPLLAPLRLAGVTPFANGMVELSYEVVR